MMSFSHNDTRDINDFVLGYFMRWECWVTFPSQIVFTVTCTPNKRPCFGFPYNDHPFHPSMFSELAPNLSGCGKTQKRSAIWKNWMRKWRLISIQQPSVVGWRTCWVPQRPSTYSAKTHLTSSRKTRRYLCRFRRESVDAIHALLFEHRLVFTIQLWRFKFIFQNICIESRNGR